jgi:hypothetical protein
LLNDSERGSAKVTNEREKMLGFVTTRNTAEFDLLGIFANYKFFVRTRRVMIIRNEGGSKGKSL